MNNKCTVILIGILLGGATNQLHAQDQADVHPYFTDKFVLDLGVYFPERSLTISVDGPVIPGSPDDIDFEADFGVKKSDELFALNFGWRFGEKWELQGQYFKANESAQKYWKKKSNGMT